MEELPLVSIIIPTYNNASVVCQAIDCSLTQSHGNCEVIVVDDGSSDGTEQMLKERYENQIVYLRQENRGTGGARNTGIRIAIGRYLQFLDADDLLEPDKISLQLGELQKASGLALSYSDYVCRDIDDEALTYPHVSPLLQRERPYHDIMMRWETDLCIPVHCFLFDARLFKEKGIAFDESLSANEDWDCWMNVFALEPEVFFVDRVLAIYRVRQNSRCRDRSQMRKSYLAALKKQMKLSASDEVVRKLATRKKEIEYLYRDASPLSKAIGRCPPLIRKGYSACVPWRVRQGIWRLVEDKMCLP